MHYQTSSEHREQTHEFMELFSKEVYGVTNIFHILLSDINIHPTAI